MNAPLLTAPLLVASLLVGCGSVDPPPPLGPAPVEPVRALLIRVVESGPVPARAVLGEARTVVFLNATADRLVSVRFSDARVALVEPGVGLGFAQADGGTVTRPALRPGAAAVLAVPPGCALDYSVTGLSAAAAGRVERAEEP